MNEVYFSLPKGTIIGNPLYYPIFKNNEIDWRSRGAHPERFVARFGEGNFTDGQLSYQYFSHYKIFGLNFNISRTNKINASLTELVKEGLAEQLPIVQAYGLPDSLDISTIPPAYRTVGVITAEAGIEIHHQRFDSQGKPIFDDIAVNYEDDPRRAIDQIRRANAD